MRQKIFVVVMMLLMCLSTIVILPNDLEVEATSEGGGGAGEEGNVTSLDYDFIWSEIWNIANVVHDAYDEGDIRKGRAFGTKGDKYTAENILKLAMNDMDLENVAKLPLGPVKKLKYLLWDYSSKIETIDFKLTVNHPGYPYVNDVPKNEIGVFPSALKNNEHVPWSMDYNNSFNNIKLITKDFTSSWWNQILPNPNHYYNISCTEIDILGNLTGNVTYVANGDPLPEAQEGRLFILEEVGGVGGCHEQLENVTNATGVLLIHNTTTRYKVDEYDYNISNLTAQSARVNNNESNLTAIIELLENNTIIIATNTFDNQLLTFMHNFTCFDSWWPTYDFFIVKGFTEIIPFGQRSGKIFARIFEAWFLNIVKQILRGRCLGFIIYDDYLEDVHIMDRTSRFWMGWAANKDKRREMFLKDWSPALQIFSVNQSVGEFLEEKIGESTNTVSGYFEQKYTCETRPNILFPST